MPSFFFPPGLAPQFLLAVFLFPGIPGVLGGVSGNRGPFPVFVQVACSGDAV